MVFPNPVVLILLANRHIRNEERDLVQRDCFDIANQDGSESFAL